MSFYIFLVCRNIFYNLCKQKTLNAMIEYLSKVYRENIVVEDFEYKKGSMKSALDLVIAGKEQWGGIDTTNVDIKNHIDEYNKNGIFFSEKKKINRIRYMSAGSGEISSQIEKVPIVGQYYPNSDDYLLERNVSKEALHRLKNGFERNYARELSTLKSHDEAIEKIFQCDKRLNDGYTSESYKNELKRLLGRSNNYSIISADTIAKQMLEIRKEVRENIIIPELNLKVLGLERKNRKLSIYVEDLHNDLNRRKYQKAINYYKSKGIEIKNTFLGNLSSFAHSFPESTNPNFDYDTEFVDGGNKKLIMGGINLIQSVASGYVFYNIRKYSANYQTNNENRSRAQIDNEKAYNYNMENMRNKNYEVKVNLTVKNPDGSTYKFVDFNRESRPKELADPYKKLAAGDEIYEKTFKKNMTLK